jgi:hypothetical protein
VQVIHIPSDSCPKCGSGEGTCTLAVLRIKPMSVYGKVSNEFFIDNFLGRDSKVAPIFEAYAIQGVDCSKDRGNKIK